jgi:hypothetical protein
MNFYKPGDLGYEAKIKDHFKMLKGKESKKGQ